MNSMYVCSFIENVCFFVQMIVIYGFLFWNIFNLIEEIYFLDFRIYCFEFEVEVNYFNLRSNVVEFWN